MIVKRWTREEILEKLKDKMNKKKPLFFASCGTGPIMWFIPMKG